VLCFRNVQLYIFVRCVHKLIHIVEVLWSFDRVFVIIFSHSLRKLYFFHDLSQFYCNESIYKLAIVQFLLIIVICFSQFCNSSCFLIQWCSFCKVKWWLVINNHAWILSRDWICIQISKSYCAIIIYCALYSLCEQFIINILCYIWFLHLL